MIVVRTVANETMSGSILVSSPKADNANAGAAMFGGADFFENPELMEDSFQIFEADKPKQTL